MPSSVHTVSGIALHAVKAIGIDRVMLVVTLRVAVGVVLGVAEGDGVELGEMSTRTARPERKKADPKP